MGRDQQRVDDVSPEDPRHGTVAGYVAHRRDKADCAACREAMRLYERNRQARRYLARGRLVVDGTGTRRRLQALVAIGHSFASLDRELGRKRTYAHYLANTDGEVYRSTALAVASLYERLCMTPAPGWRGERQRRIAAGNGYAPPLAWDDIDDPAERPNLGGHDDEMDPVVVERLLAGRDVASTRAEKVEAMRRWLATGRSEKSLCDTHGWKPGRYIEREAGAA